jgi:hypothetical protein
MTTQVAEDSVALLREAADRIDNQGLVAFVRHANAFGPYASTCGPVCALGAFELPREMAFVRMGFELAETRAPKTLRLLAEYIAGTDALPGSVSCTIAAWSNNIACGGRQPADMSFDEYAEIHTKAVSPELAAKVSGTMRELAAKLEAEQANA